MICGTCYSMLRGHSGRQWKGSFVLNFVHHATPQDLDRASSMACCICRKLKENVTQDDLNLFQKDRPSDGLLSAHLSDVRNKEGLYRLDFKLGRSKPVGTFLLKQTASESESHVYTPSADGTASEEVLQLARHWIRTCTSMEHENCPTEDFSNRSRLNDANTRKLPRSLTQFEETQHSLQRPRFYPTRLIELPESKQMDQNERVCLIETKKDRPNGHYVTLSHCWGNVKFECLKIETLDAFRAGVLLNSLPKTFRQAIDFARRLSSQIRYIWIDSLCILQNDIDDWAYESTQMYHVYRNSYCNISATAASDSHKGLYFGRDPQRLWEDEINLNTDGIPKVGSRRDIKTNKATPTLIRRCTILDPSFWDRKVDDAPANRRAWVLQERLLAPRVLHFCEDQIAWECRHLDAAEAYPNGVSNLEVRFGNVRERMRLKTLLPSEYGPHPLVLNSSEISNSAHEKWKSIVERYSTTRLSKSNDKLVALAGIAQVMASHIRGFYVAGLWEKYLASQLLWRVDPVYENGDFTFPSRRPSEYRAPSFSWAAIDAPQGIRCGETKKESELEITVDKIHVQPKPGSKFGPIEDGCYIELTCPLIKVEVGQKPKEEPGPKYFRWKLPSASSAQNDKIHPSVYLDSPGTDYEEIKGPNGNVFCVPAYKDHANYIICLLIQLKNDSGYYRRVGLTKIPPYDGTSEAFWSQKLIKKRIRIV